MDNLERQRQIESDSVRDGCVRWAGNIDHQQATDTTPYRNLIALAWRSLADAIRAEQDLLQTGKTKLPAYGLQLLSFRPEPMALITFGTLFNMIARSEYETCLSPRKTPVAYEIGQRCRIERLVDLANHREVDVAEILRPRNRTRNAPRLAAQLAALVDNEEDWTHNFRGYHLGEKLISLALKFAVVEGKPIFESKEDHESSGKSIKTMQRIGLSEAAEAWIAEQTPEALDLFNPIYLPTIVEPRPWIVIFPTKSHFMAVKGKQPMIRDRDAMSVTTEVTENLLWSAERRFGTFRNFFQRSIAIRTVDSAPATITATLSSALPPDRS